MNTLLHWLDVGWGWTRAAFIASLALFGSHPAEHRGYVGYVEAEYTRLGNQTGGTLAALAVERGDPVRAGMLIAQFDATQELAVVAEARARVAQAQAQLADLSKGKRSAEIEALLAQRAQAEAAFVLSNSEFVRQTQLVAGGVAALGKLDEAKAAYDRDRARIKELDAQIEAAQLGARDDQVRAAQAQVSALRAALDQAEYRLEQRSLSAPVDAKVVDTLYALGEHVPPGAAVVTLLPPGKVKVRFFVPEPLVTSVRVGQRVRVACDGCTEGLAARVTYIAPQAEYTPPVIFSRDNRAKLVFLIEAVPESPDGLHPGLPVEVMLP